MAEGLKTPSITQLEFTDGADHRIAERIARFLGYEQYAYTSTSALWGLFCMRENPEHETRRDRRLVAGGHPIECTRNAVIIKTAEFGFLVLYDMEDLGLDGRGHKVRT